VKKKLNNILSKSIFSIFFVYILILGIFNVTVALSKNSIEQYLVKALDAQEVHIGNISNLPLVFINGTELSVVVTDEISLSIKGFYLHYRFWKLIIKQWDQVISEIKIDKINFLGHNKGINEYITQLKKKYQDQQSKLNIVVEKNKDKKIELRSLNFNFIINIKQFIFSMRMMKEFQNKIELNNFNLKINNQDVIWNSSLKLDAIWSNCVFLANSDMDITGKLSNLTNPHGEINILLDYINLGGLPLIDKKIVFFIDITNKNFNILFSENLLNTLKIDKKDFKIEYADYEEFELLDYLFKPGNWTFDLDVISKPDLNIIAKLYSSKYLDYGLDLRLKSIAKDEYELKLKLKTHYFGTILGDLNISDRKDLYPLPSGQLQLQNVRFIIPGLVFSGNVIADAIIGKNEMDLTAFDVSMNNGYIGNTSVKFGFPPNGAFNIDPIYLPNAALAIKASIFTNIKVDINLLDVDGDFVVKNIKIPVFGLKDSRYKGSILIIKSNRKSDILVNADVQGYLDGEEQIQALVKFKNNSINIPKFRFINQGLSLNGDVLINSARSNTTINIKALGNLSKNHEIPIKVDVIIQKTNSWVYGLIDNQIIFNTKTIGNNTKFDMKLDNYPLSKLGLGGNLSGNLVMGFTPEGWSRFGLQKGIWNIEKRKIIIDFDALGETNVLDTRYMRIGLDNEILDSYGYFKILSNGGITGAFRFDRGGSLQFSTASYVWKLNLDLQKFIINNLFELSLFNKVSFLNSESTERVSINLLLGLNGLWTNPDFEASLNIEGLDIINNFQFIIDNIKKKENIYALTNIRLRHNIINFDSDICLEIKTNEIDANLQGAFAIGNFIKTEFELDYQKNKQTSSLKYKVPNLYFLSRKPINLVGAIYNQNNNYFLISDHHKYGLVGSYMRDKYENFWDITFQSDNIKFDNEGVILSNIMNIITSLSMDFNKMKFIGDISDIKGVAEINALVSGNLDNPILAGNIVLQDLFLNLKSLKNDILISNKINIPITNGQILFNDIPIYAKGGGLFGLDGAITIYETTAENDTLLNFYSKKGNNNQDAFLDWNLKIPYFSIKGKTFINSIRLQKEVDEILLGAKIKTENLVMGLELGDSVNEIFNTSIDQNPIVPLLGALNMDISLDLSRRTRFFNQLFDLYFDPNQELKIQGNIGDNTVVIDGDINIERGIVSYLGKDLKIDSGNIQFSGDKGDPYPSINITTINTERTAQNETVEVYVNFEGKLPNIELASISSIPIKSRSELYGLLGFGGIQSRGSIGSTAEEVLASGVGIAENALFTSPFSQRIQRIIPIDNLQITTDVLGNLTRSLSTGNAVSGFSILHGSELEVGQYLPNISGLQVQYKLRLESPNNSGLNTSSSLNQYHQAGIHWSYPVPNFAQVGVGASIAGEVKQQNPQQTEATPEFVLEGSLRRRF